MASRENASLPSQSKRPPPSQHGSDSQSDQAQHHHHHHHHGQRHKNPKHLVGGGAGARLHARVPSSKGLHKPHHVLSTGKLARRAASPSPERALPPFARSHRRATSDLSLSRDATAAAAAQQQASSSAAHLKKNASHTTLKRNRSKADVAAGKKSKSTSNLKRLSSHAAAAGHKLKSANVHFNLGDDDQDESPEDEWVDASASASPHLSRRASVVSGGQAAPADPSHRPTTTNGDGGGGGAAAAAAAAAARRASPSHEPHQLATTEHAPASGASSVAHSPDHHHQALSRKQNVPLRLLQRTSSMGAPPKMTTENASVYPPSSRPHSPDSGVSTLSGTPQRVSQMRPGSSGKDQLTSRFVTTTNNNSNSNSNSGGTGSAATPDSFLTRAHAAGAAAAHANGLSEAPPRRPLSMGNLPQADRQSRHVVSRAEERLRAESSHLASADGGEEGGVVGLASSSQNRRRNGGLGLASGEMNRTQQKLDLQRASSNLEPAHHHPALGMGMGMGLGLGLGGVAAAAAPLMSGTGYDSRDPRLGKLLERTGMEYLVVRRHQNPVARSIARLNHLPGAERAKRIPRTAAAPPTDNEPTRPSSGYNGIGGVDGTTHTAGSSSNSRGAAARHQDPAVVGLMGHHQAAAAAAAASKSGSGGPPLTPRRGGGAASTTTMAPNGAAAPPGSGLSGASLADGEEAQTMALLRNMWDKNMDLSASQE